MDGEGIIASKLVTRWSRLMFVSNFSAMTWDEGDKERGTRNHFGKLAQKLYFDGFINYSL